MKVNIGRSVKVAIAQRDMSMTLVRVAMGVSKQRMSVIANTQKAGVDVIERLSAIFNLKPSEFIALGEQEEPKE